MATLSRLFENFAALPWQRQALVVLALAVAAFLIYSGVKVVRVGIGMIRRGLKGGR